jgi:hypothetical protein
MQACALLLALGACADKTEIRVQLDAHPHMGNDLRQLDVQAQVTGAQGGLRYKWFSGLGEFDPQESTGPKTSFYFGPNSAKDRIWVELWREDERLAEARLDVSTDAVQPAATANRPNIQIAITDIPPYDPAGGPDTRANIAGTITGESGREYSVVIYARADAWYIQPVPFALQQVQADNTWKSWTHTGSDYAALVVRSDYKPATRLDVLPPVEGDVVARVIVEGKKR